jgi:hypothetical protein
MWSLPSRLAGVAMIVALLWACAPGGGSGRLLALPASPTSPGGVTVLAAASPGLAVRSTFGPMPNVSNMAPGDTVTQTATVTSATATPVAMLAALPAGATCAAGLSGQIRLTVTDVATGGSLYHGPLCDIPMSIPACGASGTGGCAAWTVGESHRYDLVASLPLATGNAFQGARAEADLWFGTTNGDVGAIQTLIPAPGTGAGIERPMVLGAALIAWGLLLLGRIRRPRTTRPNHP